MKLPSSPAGCPLQDVGRVLGVTVPVHDNEVAVDEDDDAVVELGVEPVGGAVVVGDAAVVLVLLTEVVAIVLVPLTEVVAIVLVLLTDVDAVVAVLLPTVVEVTVLLPDPVGAARINIAAPRSGMFDITETAPDR